ncbi:hypothetical protein KOW79_015503 [Hemibagrus wyckioides]|uniref:Outer dense fiber protein 2 n=1 Tax=Hemibagrus wyckioides TaxID=337641 RepID=A0A9D3NGW1_9TELE|nr:hypothetical protein KOW79_015503 [Hemibagrus wyckioides]
MQRTKPAARRDTRGHQMKEVNQLRRTKDEAKRRYQSCLRDVKYRLEQSDSTNSLQNYVQFLKASYASVFGGLPFSRSSLRAHSAI